MDGKMNPPSKGRQAPHAKHLLVAAHVRTVNAAYLVPTV